MTGLKFLADRVEGKLMSRATAGHAASIGVSGALSFASADLIASFAGWRAAFIVAAASAALAWLLVTWAVPRAIRSVSVPAGTSGAIRFQAGAAEQVSDGICDCLRHPHARDECAQGMGRSVSQSSWQPVPKPPHRNFPRGRPYRSWTRPGRWRVSWATKRQSCLGRRRLIGVALIASAVCAALWASSGLGLILLAVVLLLISGRSLAQLRRRLRRARPVSPSRPGGAPPSLYIRCLVISAASSARWPWAGPLMRAGACRR